MLNRIRRPWAVYPFVLSLAGCDALADLSQFDEAQLATPPTDDVGDVDAATVDASTHASDSGHADSGARANDAGHEAAADAASSVDSSVATVDAAMDVTADAAPDAAIADAMVVDTAPPPPPPPTGTVAIDTTTVYQTIDGFGASDVFLSSLSAQQLQLFYDPVNGIGLSMLRVGISADGQGLGTALLSDVSAAASYGAIVWGSPWSPPGADKTNDNQNNGGYLCTADAGSCAGDAYDSWASTLAAFPGWLYSQTGVSVYAISPQNEPDWTASYASCLYTGQELASFVKVLAPKLAALTPPVKLIAGEPASWQNLWSGDATCASTDNYAACFHADPDAEAAVDILATHDYGFNPVAPPSWVSHRIWETEVSGVSGSSQVGPSIDIGNGVAVATWIHNALVVGQVNAWHYWWLVASSGVDNEGLIFPTGAGPNGQGDINSPPKRVYAMGNFSKFIRPGYQRIAATGTNTSGIDLSAFQSPSDGTVVVVAINTGSAPVSLTFSMPTATTAMTPWETSATANLAAGTAIPVTAGSFVGTLDAQSVTTFVSSH